MAVFTNSKTILMLILAFWGTGPKESLARPKTLEGPIPAFVERVIDGDTLVVRARIWLGQELHVMVRVNGIDTPEIKGRCREERTLAISATRFVKRLIGQRKISLSHIRQGKYAGRVIADVTNKDGQRLSTLLLGAGLARPYKRGRRKSWCNPSPASPIKKANALAVR